MRSLVVERGAPQILGFHALALEVLPRLLEVPQRLLERVGPVVRESGL